MLYHARVLLIAGLVGAAVFGYCAGRADLRELAPFAALGAVILVFLLRPKRKRRMSAAARRRTIAKWSLATGKKFNPRYHEIDHVVPFSRGGNETEDNLRVVDRKANRAKGARSPWWDVLRWR